MSPEVSRPPEALRFGYAWEHAVSVTGVPAVMRHEHREVVVSGVRLAYIEREATEAPDASPVSQRILPPILLLHALLATAETLGELVAGLPTDRRVVALDLSSAQLVDPAKKLKVDQASLTRLIHGFIEHIGLGRPVLVGHSHGGVLALRLAATAPQTLKGLALLCPAHPFGGYRSRVVNFYLRQPGRMLALSIPLAPSWMILRAYNEAAGTKKRLKMSHLRPHLKVLRNRNKLRTVLDILRTWEEDMDALRAALRERAIDVPTLLLWGEEDPVVPITSAAELQQHLVKSQLVRLEGMGHLLVEEVPDECASLISHWLSRVNT